jgi:hypothetical protein
LLRYLRYNLTASLRKGYHSELTDFAAAQRRISSNIFLRTGARDSGTALPCGQTPPQKTVFAIDISGSMDSWVSAGISLSPLEWVKAQMIQLLENALEPGQQFNIILFDHEAESWPHGFMSYSPQAIDRATQAIQSWESRGGTNIQCALDLAYRMPGVDCVHLLSDGESGIDLDQVEQMSRCATRLVSGCTDLDPAVREWTHIPCHTTGIHDGSDRNGGQVLQQIARVTGGLYRHVSGDDFVAQEKEQTEQKVEP